MCKYEHSAFSPETWRCYTCSRVLARATVLALLCSPCLRASRRARGNAARDESRALHQARQGPQARQARQRQTRQPTRGDAYEQ